MSTALICIELCSRFGIDEFKGKIAGIAHDIARETPIDNKLISTIDDDYLISDEEKLNPVLLHGRIGARMLRKNFNLNDNEILQAIRWHTTGHPDMGKLGQILFIADYIEPGRKHITNSIRATIMQMDLDEMTLKVLNDQTAYLRNRGYRITKATMLLFENLSNSGRIKTI
ncbi:MAG: bis(5'-nucleosyl)-tetraphosphatase (symmetrical) YqeK [Spirochaetales bacterium]|nr:bis(5'-nucleosyl)-tetraphosphatase (symmetrical) YqeK [Spirochaetales bacterium]